MKKCGSIVGKQKYRAPGYIWISGKQQIFVRVNTPQYSVIYVNLMLEMDTALETPLENE